MKNYDSFASFYDFAMGDQREVATALMRIIRRHAPRAKTLLEFGCGSGSLLAVFVQRYRCSGIDLSAGMAALARKKVPAATIVVGDIACTNLKRRFDVIVCAFDTINHIAEFSGWKEVFKRAHEHLEDRGVFIFDINTEKKIDSYHQEPPYVEVGEKGVSVFDVTRTGGSRYTLSVKVFKQLRQNNFRLHEMEVRGATFPVSRIRRELAKYFTEIRLVDLERQRPSSKSEELYFICKGPRVR